MLPHHYLKHISACEPYALNHEISFKVHGGRVGCEKIRELLQAQVEANSFKVRSKEVVVIVELSKSRKTTLTSLFNALRHSEAHFEDKTVFDHSMRNFEIFETNTSRTTGKWDSKKCEWIWNTEVCEELALPTPDIAMVQTR